MATKKKTSKRKVRKPEPEEIEEEEEEEEEEEFEEEEEEDDEDDDEFEGADPPDPEEQPVGDFVLRITDVVKDVSSQGNPMWVWDLEIERGADGDREHAGHELKYYTANTPSAVWKIEEIGLALGLIDKEGERVRFSRSTVIGKRVMGRLELQEYQGRSRTSIAGIGRYKGKADPKKASKKKAGKKVKRKVSEVEDDDIPF